MELIAIIGKPGVGKTTVSKYLDQTYDDISYLNIDESVNNNLELLQLRTLALKDIKDNILMGKYEKKFYECLNEYVMEWVAVENKKGTKYGLVDFATMHKISGIWDLFKYKILVLKDNVTRKEHLALRAGDNMANVLNLYGDYAFSDFNYDVDFEIINNGSIDELCQQAKTTFEIIRNLSNISASYFIIKPDGLRHIKTIYSFIEPLVNNCDQVCFYKIDRFSELIRKLYYKLFLIKELEFDKKFDYLIDALTSLYGNKGILILMYKNNKNEEEYMKFIKEIYDLKHEIRKNIMNNNIRVMIKTDSCESLGDSITFNNENYFVALSKLLSVIHCPEPNIAETIEELKILFEDGLISTENKMDIEKIINMDLL